MRGRDLAVAATDRWKAAHDSTRWPIRRAASASEAGWSPALPELFTLRTALRRAVPHQRQGGAKRRRRELPEQQRSNGRRPRCQRTERQLYLAAGRRPGAASKCGNRRDTRARDAACPGCERDASRSLVVAWSARRQVPFLRRGGATASRDAGSRAKSYLVQPASRG